MKIVIAPDSFKGSMSATEAADAIERGVLSVFSNATTIKIPMADGGEGTVDALVASTNGRIIEKKATDPLGFPVNGKYGILGDEKTAVIEMASVSGLPLVPENKRNPLNTTTYGTGELIADALNAGCRNLIIGIGGSATNDCGTGMAQALGIKFLPPNGTEITQPMCGGLLTEIEKIDTTQIHPAVTESFITVACDVDNPLLGQKGCAHVYAPQKGATPEIVEKLENDMQKFADVLENETGRNVRNYPGAGAAGAPAVGRGGPLWRADGRGDAGRSVQRAGRVRRPGKVRALLARVPRHVLPARARVSGALRPPVAALSPASYMTRRRHLMASL